MSNGILIVGGSQAGVQLACTLRESGYEPPIVLVESGAHEPYQRPALSKAFLDGSVTVEALRFRTREFYDTHRIDLVLGERITRVNRDGAAGTATGASGREFAFDELALAVGARARRLNLEGEDLSGVFYLRDADDAEGLKASLDAARDIVVIGGGFIGLEVAAGARKAGKNVTVLEAAPRLIGRAVGGTTSAFFLTAHRSRGITVELDARVGRLVGRDGAVDGVELQDGTVIPAQVVLIGVGVQPRTELAEQLGLAIENGVRVDEFSRASDGRTIAIGDVANLPNPYAHAIDAERIRLESVNNAVEQARNAALTVLGTPSPYELTPWFWSNQGDLKLQMAGLSGGHHEEVIRGDPGAEKFSTLYYAGGRLIGADCVNSPVDFMAVKQALSRGLHLPSDRVSENVPLKTLFVENGAA